MMHETRPADYPVAITCFHYRLVFYFLPLLRRFNSAEPVVEKSVIL